MSIPDEISTQHNTEIITDRDMSIPDEKNLQYNTKTVTRTAMSIPDEINTKPSTEADPETDTTTGGDTDTQTKTTADNIELCPTTIAEIDRTFSSAAYHMGDFITEYRQIRNKMYSTIHPTPSSPRPSSPSSRNSSASAAASSSLASTSPNPEPAERGSAEREPAERELAERGLAESTPASATSSARMLHPLTKTDLNTLLLLLCITTKSLLKREGYLEAKVEELTMELDGQMRIKDDWVLVHGSAIPDTAGEERWGKGWFGIGTKK